MASDELKVVLGDQPDAPGMSVAEALKFLNEQGYVLWKAPQLMQIRYRVDMNGFAGHRVRIAVIGDTHLGSQWQQLTHLNAFYRYASKRDVQAILHAGDLTDGEGVYGGHRYELFALGADDQIDYAANNYPRARNGAKTYLISGNHDASFMALAGIDVVKQVCARRDDMVYLGYGGATVEIGGLNAYMMHPDGGVPYARSYRLQKIIEQLPGGDKPHVLVIGHLHITNLLPMYRNVVGLIAGCFQAQTPYLRRKGLAPDVGGWILEFNIGDRDVENGLIGLKIEWVPFPVAKERDF